MEIPVDRDDVKYLPLSRGWGLLALLPAIPTFFAFALCGQPERGVAAACSISLLVLVLRKFWPLKTRLWFWIATVLYFSIHVLLVIEIQFHRPSVPMISIAFPALLLDYMLIYFIMTKLDAFTSEDRS